MLVLSKRIQVYEHNYGTFTALIYNVIQADPLKVFKKN